MIQIRHFRQKGCYSYLIWDADSREAMAIDASHLTLKEFTEFVSQQNLNLRFSVDTHIHADHFSVAHLLRREHGCQVIMGRSTESERPDLRVMNGESVSLGKTRVEFLACPGHTQDSIAVLVEGFLFTGDTLLIGATGRTDFMNSDPVLLWNSIHAFMENLSPETIVYPGHDYNDRIFTTLRAERELNSQLLLGSPEKFSEFKKKEALGSSGDASAFVKFNLERDPELPENAEAVTSLACGKAEAETEGFQSIPVEQYRPVLAQSEKGVLYADVREWNEYNDGHMPGAVCLPLSDLGQHLGQFLSANRVYISCLSGRRSVFAAKTLSRRGVRNITNILGGYKAWTQAGFPVER